MSSEYVAKTSLNLDRLKIFEWMNFLRRQGNSGKLSWQKFHNCLACEFTGHYACKNAEMNLKSTSTNGFNFRIINSLMASWGYAWPGLTVTPLGDLIFMHHKNSLFRVHLTLTNIQLTPKRSYIIYNLNQTINLYSTIQLRERLSDFREK